MAFLGALAKFGMGMLHGDGNTRQCMATSVVAYKQSFGFDAPPYTYADFEESDVIVLVGSNLCLAHPIMWERVLRNPHSPEIVVIDPRMTETAMNATQHLAIFPKSDQSLLYGIAKLLIERGAVAEEFVAAHTTGFDEFMRVRSALHAGTRGAGDRTERDANRTLRGDNSQWRACLVLVDDGSQPESSGSPHGAGDHQPRAHDGQYGSAWNGG